MNFDAARTYILDRLSKELPKDLYYHRIEHTFDMYEAALRLIELENADPHSAMLIETAALYHDAGMIHSYRDHEFSSEAMIRDILPEFDYNPDEIEEIAELIRVTKMPQAAVTHNQMIICDADLDALGREDFFITSFQLQLEWKLYNILDTTIEQWFKFEIDFLKNHHYYTASARKLRDEKKNENLKEMERLLGIINS